MVHVHHFLFMGMDDNRQKIYVSVTGIRKRKKCSTKKSTKQFIVVVFKYFFFHNFPIQVFQSECEIFFLFFFDETDFIFYVLCVWRKNIIDMNNNKNN